MPNGDLTREHALRTPGLEEPATEQEILAAHGALDTTGVEPTDERRNQRR